MSPGLASTSAVRQMDAFRACGIGLFVLDADLRVLEANEAFLRLLDRPCLPVDAVGCAALFGEDHGLIDCPAQATLSDGQCHKAKFHHTVDGRTLQLSCSAAPIFDEDDRVAGVVGALEDVTDAISYPRTPPKPTSAQAGTREQERRLHALEEMTHSLSLGLERGELETKIVAGMTALLKADMYAVYVSENYRNTLTFAAPPYLSPESRDRLVELVRETVEAFEDEGITFSDVSLIPHATVISRDEPALAIESHLNVPITVDGAMAGLLTVTSDLPEAFDRLDLSLLATLANEAALAIDRMQMCRRNVQNQRMAAVGETVATIAHYITNITSNLAGSRHMMDLAVQARDWTRTERTWSVIRRSNQAVSQLVMNLLNYSKDREPVLEPTDLTEVIEFVAEQCMERADQFGVVIVLDIEDLPDEIMVDSGQIEHGLMNLVVNGVEAMAHGGTLSICARCDASEGLVRIAVADEGPGIPAGDLERIFEPFYSSKGSKGTGIGLAVSKKIAQEHGGDLAVESTPGEGTTFTIALPIRQAGQASPHAARTR